VPKHHSVKKSKSSDCKAAQIINFGTGMKSVIKFALWPLYPRRIKPRCPRRRSFRTWYSRKT